MRTSAIICQLVALAIVVVHHGDSNLVKLSRAEGAVPWQIVQAHFVSSRHKTISNEAASFDFPVEVACPGGSSRRGTTILVVVHGLVVQ